MSEHVQPVKTYLWVFVALLVLTVATTEVARIDLGVFSTPVALLIAAAKAVIVALFFMHLKWGGYRTRVVAVAGLVWFLVLIVFVLADVLTRDVSDPVQGWTTVGPSERSAATHGSPLANNP